MTQTDDHNAIIAQLNKINEDTTQTRIDVGKVEQHLKDLNGTVARHETDIKDNQEDIKKNEISLAKIIGISGFTGAAISLVIIVVKHFILGV